jgi:hypothetical protein
MQPIICTSDGTENASSKICATTNMINDLTRLRIFKEPINGEIAAQCILTIITEAHSIRAPTIDVHAVCAECCNLNRSTAVTNKHYPE